MNPVSPSRLYRFALLLLLCLLGSNVAVADRDWLVRYGEDPQGFDEVIVGENRLVYYQQRMLGEAIVEKDCKIYQFGRWSGELLDWRIQWRDDLPDRLPDVQLSPGDVAAMVEGEVLATVLYVISPESDIFPLDPVPENPCWIVRSQADDGIRITVVDAVTGSELGRGVPPPYDAISLTGPIEFEPCSASWAAWATNAANWFNTMGYDTWYEIWPVSAVVRSSIESTEYALFYELAHGDQFGFQSGCAGGSPEYTTAGGVAGWIFDYEKMPFTFLGSCDGQCSEDDGSLSFAFRKGSVEETASVGYCGMSEARCDVCWGYSLDWQDEFFYGLNQGWTVQAAFDQADASYPMCADNACMRLAGDPLLTLVPVIARAVPDPFWSELLPGVLTGSGAGRGVAWGDFDDDGDHDLYQVNAGVANKLVRYDGNHQFVDWPVGFVGDTGDGAGAAWADYDNDGDLDLYLANRDGANLLLRNAGTGLFYDGTSGPLGDPNEGTGVAWADYDGDGNVDLYLANHDGANKLFRNDGGGMFSDATSGPLGDTGPSAGIAWADYDDDGDLDLYVANDGGANRLLRNDGGVFTDATSGPLGDAGHGKGVAWGDCDNDGDLDLYLANGGEANKLFRNDGGGAFTDATSGPLGDAGQGRGVAWGDYDNDGDVDLFLANHDSANKLFRNDGGGVFMDATSGPLGDTGQSVGAAWCDYDGDGDLDLCVSSDGSSDKLMRNKNATGNHWLQIDLVGRQSNRRGIGARVRAVSGGLVQVREVTAGSGYLSQNSLTVEFGLGSETLVDTLQVDWPSGTVQVVTDVAVDQRFDLPEMESLPWTDVTAGPLADAGAGKGAAWGDYDGDGDPDLYLVNENEANRLLRNDGGGTFVDATPALLADTGPGCGAAWGDYDNDGRLDLYLVNHDAPNRLFHNDGAGAFSDATQPPLDDAGPGHDVCWTDYNQDGLLDLYVAQGGSANLLLKSLGGIGAQWWFAAQGGAVCDDGPGVSAAWCDYDDDGDPDVYLTNSYAANRLFQNGGSFGFGDVTGGGLLGSTHNGAGCAWGDYDNDGDFDLYFANDGNADYLLNNNGGIFSHVVGDPLGDGGSGRSVTWVDYDNDGDLDIHVTRFAQEDLLLRNDGVTGFEEDYLLLPPVADASHGTAWCDFDQDGDLDLYQSNYGQPNRLLRNETTAGRHWLQVDLVGQVSNLQGLGARLRLHAGGSVQSREVGSQSSCFSQSASRVAFGLDGTVVADSLELYWPSGIHRVYYDLAADQLLTLYEQQTDVAGPADLPAAFCLTGNYPNPFNPRTTIGFELPAPALVRLSIYDVTGRLVRELVDGGEFEAGRHGRLWDGRDKAGREVGSGIYFYRLIAGGFQGTGKMSLLR